MEAPTIGANEVGSVSSVRTPRESDPTAVGRPGSRVVAASDGPRSPRAEVEHFDLRRADWRELFERVGIHGIICVDDHGRALPATVDDTEIEKLRAKEVDGAIPETIKMRELGWKIGEQARIKDGPYIGLTGTIHILPETTLAELDAEARCKLAMEIFGRVTLVEIPLHHIEKLER